MAQKLTKRDIDGFTYAGGAGAAWDIRWDTQIPSFGCRIYPSGKKAFIVWYRHRGRKRIHTVGQYGKITLDIARDLAIKHLAKIADDIDPTEQKRKARSAYIVSSAFDQFLEKYAKLHNKHWKEKKRIFDNDVIPLIGKLPVHEVTKSHIVRILDRITDRGAPIAANRALAHVKKFFRWCVQRDIIQFSPADGVTKQTPDTSRDRVLTALEIKDIWTACDEIGYPYGLFIQLALVTAQRRNEIATLKWKDIDFKNNIWHLPRENTKTDRAHDVPLSDLALSLLEKAPEMGELVFTTTGTTPYSGFTQGKNALDKRVQRIRDKRLQAVMKDGGSMKTRQDLDALPEWRVHDLRRSAASHMASLRIAPHVIEKILNHSNGIISGVAAVYNRYEYGEEKQQALLKWSEHLQAEILTEGAGINAFFAEGLKKAS